MVYCTKCGTKNSDDAKKCSQCGSPLYAIGDRQYYKRMEKECFGIPGGGAIVGISIGAIIVLWGLIWVMQQAELIPETVNVWPVAIIIFGVLMIVGAIYGLRRRF
ncbi:MAG: zinc-ribbon domain-containing protein [Candidatus Bathyarchaeota archaeon]|nr:zinc-ribbon domain-containing protein [Candidatus Bathyarchaeota archaeon]MDH5788395.1 zinc-ribbon domain-containing protein [Candidatus Bathyarchaeota archaeon]